MMLLLPLLLLLLLLLSPLRTQAHAQHRRQQAHWERQCRRR